MIKILRLSNLHIREAEAEEEVVEDETPAEKVRVGLPIVSEAFMTAAANSASTLPDVEPLTPEPSPDPFPMS